MYKLVLTSIVTLFMLGSLIAQNPVVFSRIKMSVTPDQVNRLLQKGVSFDEATERNGLVVTGDFSEADIAHF